MSISLLVIALQMMSMVMVYEPIEDEYIYVDGDGQEYILGDQAYIEITVDCGD